MNPNHLDQDQHHLRWATEHLLHRQGVISVLITVTPLGDVLMYAVFPDDFGNEVVTRAFHGAVVDNYGNSVPDSVVHCGVTDDYGEVVDVDLE